MGGDRADPTHTTAAETAAETEGEMMFNKQFWKAATERAVKTGAQFVLVTLGVGLTGVTGDNTVNAFLLDYPTLEAPMQRGGR